jgi:hypothetical protein
MSIVGARLATMMGNPAAMLAASAPVLKASPCESRHRRLADQRMTHETPAHATATDATIGTATGSEGSAPYARKIRLNHNNPATSPNTITSGRDGTGASWLT